MDRVGPSPVSGFDGHYLFGIEEDSGHDRFLSPDSGDKSTFIKVLQHLRGFIAGSFRIEAKVKSLLEGLLHLYKTIFSAFFVIAIYKDGTWIVDDIENGNSRKFDFCQSFIGTGNPGSGHRNIQK